jgi:hypothetical protein
MDHSSDPRYPIGRVQLPQAPLTAEQRGQLIEQLAAFPAQLTAAARRVGGERLQLPYRPGGWTGRQLVHHLADVHLNFYLRFHLALTQQHPSIPGINQDAWAQLPDVEATPVTVSLSLLEALHTRWTILLWNLSEEQWQRGFYHPVYEADYTLEQALVQAVWHGRHHLAQLQSLSLA